MQIDNKKQAFKLYKSKECLVGKLKAVNPCLNLGLHSLRAGGATTAARAGVNDRCLKRHGRWRCDISKDGYIDDSIDSRLQISKTLNL